MLVLTGERGAGKSTLLGDAAAGFSLSGVLSLRGEDGSILLHEIGSTHAALPLAERGKKTVSDDDGPLLGPFLFSRHALSEGRRILTALAGEAAAGTVQSPVVIDEIGPLELIRGEGFADALPYLYASGRALIAVVRPTLILTFLESLPAQRREEATIVRVRYPGDPVARETVHRFIITSHTYR